MFLSNDDIYENLDPELALIGAIFRKAKSDYIISCRDIMYNGGLEYLTDKYNNAHNIVKEYNKEVAKAKKRNKDIEKYNALKKTKHPLDLVPIPKCTKEVYNAKGYIERYIRITKYYTEVELFLNSDWCDTLIRMCNLSLDFIQEQFHEIRDDIFNNKV